MNGGRVAACGVVLVAALAGCGSHTGADKARSDAVEQAHESSRHLEALLPADQAPVSAEVARRALVRDGVLLSASGTNSEATIEARFVGVGFSDGIEPARSEVTLCFTMTRGDGSRAFEVTQPQPCPA